MKKYKIIDIGMGWYNFNNLPQDRSYIKIANVCCGTNKKAIKQATHIAKVNGLKGELVIVREGSNLEFETKIV